MLAQVVAAHEPLVTDRAGKALLSSVRPEVASQFIRASKLLATCGPVAREGALPSVAANVGLQVGALSVGFAASLPRTDVGLSTLKAYPLRLHFGMVARVGGIGGYEEGLDVEPTHLRAGGIRGG